MSEQLQDDDVFVELEPSGVELIQIAYVTKDGQPYELPCHSRGGFFDEPYSIEELRGLKNEIDHILSNFTQEEIDQFAKEQAQCVIDYIESHNSRPAPEREPKPGWIYILSNGEGLYKIGRTTLSPEVRLCQFLQLPKFNIVESFESPHIERDEKRLHKRYAKYRENGEWFRIPGDLLIGVGL